MKYLPVIALLLVFTFFPLGFDITGASATDLKNTQKVMKDSQLRKHPENFNKLGTVRIKKRDQPFLHHLGLGTDSEGRWVLDASVTNPTSNIFPKAGKRVSLVGIASMPLPDDIDPGQTLHLKKDISAGPTKYTMGKAYRWTLTDTHQGTLENENELVFPDLRNKIVILNASMNRSSFSWVATVKNISEYDLRIMSVSVGIKSNGEKRGDINLPYRFIRKGGELQLSGNFRSFGPGFQVYQMEVFVEKVEGAVAGHVLQR